MLIHKIISSEEQRSAAAAMEVQLRSSDGVGHEWRQQVWEQSRVLKVMMEVAENVNEPICVPISSLVLEKVRSWIVEWQTEGTPTEDDGDSEGENPLWDDLHLLVPLLQAADFLDIQKLVRSLVNEAARVITHEDATAATIAEAFGAKPGDDPMDGLPRHVKLDVLALVGDRSRGVSLVDLVPDVCDEWRELAADPAAWALVRVRFDRSDPDIPGLAMTSEEDARLVRHAPVLGDLTFKFCPGDGVLHEALRESAVVVRGHLSVCGTPGVPVGPCALDVVWRSRFVLRELTLSLTDLEGPLHDSQGRSVWEVLAGMEALTTLSVCVDKPYASELAGKRTRLTTLTWVFTGEDAVVDGSSTAVLVDLLDGARGTLEYVGISIEGDGGGRSGLLAPLAPVLRSCTRLQMMVVPVNEVDLATALPGLRSVSLYVNQCQREEIAEGCSEVLDDAIETGTALRETGKRVQIIEDSVYDCDVILAILNANIRSAIVAVHEFNLGDDSRSGDESAEAERGDAAGDEDADHGRD